MKKSVISKLFLSLWVMMLIANIISILFRVLAIYIPDIFFDSRYDGHYSGRKYTDPNFMFWIVQILLIVLSLAIFSLFIAALVVSISKLNPSGKKTLAITTSSMGLATYFLSLVFVFVYWGGMSVLLSLIIGILEIAIWILSIISWVKTKKDVFNYEDKAIEKGNVEISFENKIRSLDKLLKDSLITELEFKKAKKDILDKINQ